MIWPLLLIYLFSLSSCSKTSSVLCVLSRAARPQSSVCVFVPVSLSDHVNPLRGLAHLLPCFFFLLPPLLPSPLVCVVPPQPPDMLSHLSVSPSCTSMWASRTGGNSPLTSQDQTAITNSVTHCLEPLATSFPWCFAADQCLIRGPQGGKTRRSSVCVITGSNQE